MYVVKNSSRALLIAMIPLAVVHAVLTAMAVLAMKAAQPSDLPSPDEVLVFYFTRLAIDAALLYVGHNILRQFAISSRYAYALMGGSWLRSAMRSRSATISRSMRRATAPC